MIDEQSEIVNLDPELEILVFYYYYYYYFKVKTI